MEENKNAAGLKNAVEKTEKKSSREEKHRDAKIEEQVNKSLQHCQSPDEKLSALIKKYIELDKDSRKIMATAKQNDKRFDLVLREKENLQQEYNKAILGKSKLESLCRELQRQNKSIKEESLSKIREEEEKRKETQSKFQKALNEISSMMHENNEKNQILREDNLEMTKKFKFILEQYEVREKQVEKINKQMELATELNEAKMAKVQMEAASEKEILLNEKEQLLIELTKCRKIISDLHGREKALREQLQLYTEKYDEFQTSLKKSNDVFTGYKTEIDKITKKMTKSEKESISWKSKYEKCNAALLDMASDKHVRDEYLYKTHRQNNQLQKLLRTLQVERKVLLQTLKDHNIERPELPEITAETITEKIEEPEPPAKTDDMDKMTQNCAELKQNLAQLLGKLDTLIVNDGKPEETPKKGKNKNRNKQKNVNPKSVEINNEKNDTPIVDSPADATNANDEGEKSVIEDLSSVKPATILDSTPINQIIDEGDDVLIVNRINEIETKISQVIITNSNDKVSMPDVVEQNQQEVTSNVDIVSNGIVESPLEAK